jgi:hypothetical protein
LRCISVAQREGLVTVFTRFLYSISDWGVSGGAVMISIGVGGGAVIAAFAMWMLAEWVNRREHSKALREPEPNPGLERARLNKEWKL